jgi:hypothetical protein
MANTLHLFGGAEVCSTRLGEAWQGAAGQGMARLGKHTASYGVPQFTNAKNHKTQKTNI